MRLRIWRGEALLARVIKRFDVVIEDLAVAAQQIADKRMRTQDELADARVEFMAKERKAEAQDKVLAMAYERAEAVRHNIAKLINA